MELFLYKTSDSNNKISKKISDEIKLVGDIRAECSILNPIIEIETTLNISTFNYAKITEFNRYYFITDIVAVNNKFWKISLKCDVLMTYASEILDLNVNVLRNPSQFNLMLEDNQLNTYADTRTQCYNFPQSLTSSSDNQFKYYLTVIGGAS